MILNRTCKLCLTEFSIKKTQLTPVSICPPCRTKIIKCNIQCLIQDWIEACPEVKMEIKFRQRKLKSGIKHYFHINGDITYTGKSENIYASAHFFVYKTLIPLIQKSFSKANLTSGNFSTDGRKFNIVIAEY